MQERRLTSAALGIGFSTFFVAVVWWYFGTFSSHATAPVPDILAEFKDAWLFSRVESDVVPSIRRMTVGYWLAVVAGVSLGFAVGWSRVLRLLIEPILTFMRSIPPVALIPPAIILLGIGDTSKIFLIAFVCTWPILVNTADGVRQIDPTTTSTARAFGLSKFERARYVILPAVSPRIFAGAQISLAFSLLLVVAAELFAARNGIGFFVAQAQYTFDSPAMWAGILLLGLLGVTLNAVFELVKRRLLRWHFATSGTNTT